MILRLKCCLTHLINISTIHTSVCVKYNSSRVLLYVPAVLFMMSPLTQLTSSDTQSTVIDEQMIPISYFTSQRFPGHVNNIKIVISTQLVDNSSSIISQDNICMRPGSRCQNFLSEMNNHLDTSKFLRAALVMLNWETSSCIFPKYLTT